MRQKIIIGNMWGRLLGMALVTATIIIVGVVMILKVASMSEEELRGENCAAAPILRKPVSTATPTSGESQKSKKE